MRRNKKIIYVVLVLLLLLMGIGYAVLNASLTVTGTNMISAITWDVHFENVQATKNSTITPTSVPVAPIGGTTTDLTYGVTFDTPGQVYEFTVDVVNVGTIDAMIESILSTIKKGGAAVETLTSNNLPSHLNYSVTYSDGLEISAKQKLVHGTSETVKVHVEFKRDITNDQLQEAAGETIIFTFGMNYIQADGTEENIIEPKQLSSDTWEEIVQSAQMGTARQYVVGSTKDVTLLIDLDDDGTPEDHTYTLRVSNNSLPSVCYGENYSGTACGFVLEFADIITTHIVNPATEQYQFGTNIGGWRDSTMRSYVNSIIYSALPGSLKTAVIPTRVVSGYGCLGGSTGYTCPNPDNEGNNFETSDHLYLLSSVEVWGSAWHDTMDTTMTRQLDYYHNEQVTISSYAGPIKQNNIISGFWWLRTAYSINLNGFIAVSDYGSACARSVHSSYGVSPAFRLA